MSLVKLIVRTPRKHTEVVSELLFEAGAGGIEELDNGKRLVIYAESRETAESIADAARALLRDALPGPQGIALEIQVDEASDWATAWTQHLGQVALTPGFVIQPLWDESPTPEGAQRLLYEPQLSFGDGAHATTRLAARAIERACGALPEATVLDYGSGTGVLGFVALLAGAREACGIDIDPVSVQAAERNAELNGLTERCRFALPGAFVGRRFEIVVANLEAPTQLACAVEVTRWAANAQRLILTGFLGNRVAEIMAAYGPGFRIAQAEHEDDWALLELEPLI